MKNKEAKYYLMVVAAMFIYGTIGIFRRYIPVSSGILACVRGIIGSVCICIYIKLKGGKLSFDMGRKNLLLLILSGGIMGFNWILLFEAYNYTSVATATLCYYMEPTIFILASPIVFKEKLTAKKLVCAAASLVGMVLVSGVIGSAAVSSSDFKGIVLGLAAAVFYASVITINKLVDYDDAYIKTVIQLASAAVILIPYVVLTGELKGVSLDARAVVMILIVGIIHTGLAYALYFGSIRQLKAQSLAILGYIDPVSALILSALVLDEKMTLQGLIGAVMIIGSALISELQLKKLKD